MTKRALGLLLPVLILVGCGSGPSTKTTATTIPLATTSSSAPGATTTTTTAVSPETVQLANKDDGTTVRVTKGTTIVVTLSSTYWKFPNPPNAAVLQPVGGVVTTPGAPNACVPGGGCGTVSVTYKAVGAGQAQITASRTTCGEALACTGSSGMFSVQVIVTAG